MDKEKIRPLYSEFQGYLSQAPEPQGHADDTTGNRSLWEMYNNSVNLLNDITGENYSRFLIKPEEDGTWIRINTYRQVLGGLISFLHAKFFLDEPHPLNPIPNTIITQSQQQNQTAHIQMLLEINSKLDEKIREHPEGSKEKKFLQKIKNSLSSITSISQLISQLIKTSKEMGLDFDDLIKLFQ